MNFIGREDEISELNQLYKDKSAKLAVIYGRRRVGKSTLVNQFASDKTFIQLEGLERQGTNKQIKQVIADLAEQLNDPILASASLKEWHLVFNYITAYLKKQTKKVVLFFDEFQWLAANQTGLVSLFKKYWDQFWSKQNVLIILCGSVSSYMIKRVIQSKALYGRVSWELCLEPLHIIEIDKLLQHKRSKDEVMLYALTLGGIPKYINEINPKQSFDQNINRLCFTKRGILINEYEKIFYSQFKEVSTYQAIVEYIKDKPKSFKEITQKLNMSTGGSSSFYLDNLEKALLTTSYTPYSSSEKSKLKKHKLTDEYIRFYFKYIHPNLQKIKNNTRTNLFAQLVKPHWHSWLGFSFENFCVKNALLLAEKMGFEEAVINWGPLFFRGDESFQIDLVYTRSDRVIVVCEIKFIDNLVKTKVIPEVKRKCELIKAPDGYTIEKALICRHGAEQSLIEAEYFDHILNVDDFFK